MSSNATAETRILSMKTAKDVHVLTVYVDEGEVRIVAELGNLAWLPAGWREELMELFKPTSGQNGVIAEMHPAGLALKLSGAKSELYWELHAQQLVEEYIRDRDTAWPDVAAHPASKYA